MPSSLNACTATTTTTTSTTSADSTATTSRPLVFSPLLGGNSTCLSGSSLSLHSNSSTSPLLADESRKTLKSTNNSRHHHNHCYHHHHHQQQQQQQQHRSMQHHQHNNYGGTASSRKSSSSSNSTSSKRGKKSNWGSRERAGMSFLIVIAFFAVFGLIILTELFMIDEKSHGGMIALRHGNQGNRLGDSMPDYDNVKDDYDLLDDSLLSDNKLGFVQLQDNKLRIQDASMGDAGRGQAGVLLNSAPSGYGVGGGSASVPIIPWGKVLPTIIEETLPRHPAGVTPTDGSWQVVNGTRFKFFVFSAYYDRRDGARLVRIVGATKTRGPERVWCRFWYVSRHNGTEAMESPRYTSATVMARVKIIRENWNLKYSACFVLCPIRASDLDVPQYISVVSRLRAPPGNILELRNTDWDADFTANRTGRLNARNSFSANAESVAPATFSSSASATTAFWQLPAGHQVADKIAVCVKPFHFNYDQALYLMEYLEFYALMGVSHFTFYNHTTGPHATCVLQHYVNGDVPDLSTATDEEYNPITNASAATSSQPTQKQQEKQQQQSENATKKRLRHISTNYVKPTINILPWNLRMRSQKEIRTEGLFAALNDCLYRTMYRYKYLALVDLDEFIIPRHNDTLNELINSLNQRFRNRNTGAYSFQNAFFYLQFADDPLVLQEPEKSLNSRLRAGLVTQRKTRRRFKLHPQKQRSKYICKPEAVIEAGNHFVWEFLPGRGSLNVPPTDAILHHYRVCEFGGNDCVKAPSIVDRTATKYVNRLVQRVNAVYNYLKKPCDLPDLPALPTQPPTRRLKQQQKQTQTAKQSVTKILKDFKMQLKERINSNNEAMPKNTTSELTSSSASTHGTPATTSMDNEYDDPNRIVVFERDAAGQTVLRVKYREP